MGLFIRERNTENVPKKKFAAKVEEILSSLIDYYPINARFKVDG